MTPGEEPSDGPNMKVLRKEYPSGWMILTKYPSVPLLIDALIDADPGWQFNQTEWAEQAGVSRESIRKRLGLLLDVEVIEEIDESSGPRYRVNEEGAVMESLHRLNDAVNRAASAPEHELVEEEVAPTVSPFKPGIDDRTGGHTYLDEVPTPST